MTVTAHLKDAVCHAQFVTGQWVFVLNRALLGFLAMGIVFTMGYMPVASLISSPEAQLQAQGFQINYYEMVRAHQDVSEEADPAWDGALSGLSSGYALTRDLPFVFPMIGALIGAVVGYQLDNHI